MTAPPGQPPTPLAEWFEALLQAEGLAAMGHAQRQQHADPGLGWVYYGLARLIRPQVAVVIGSWRGFVPLVLARALTDNGVGRVVFIDPSLVDGFWRDPATVAAYFSRFGVDNVEHVRMTTQEFVQTPAYRELTEVGLVFIDGYHSHAQASFDFEAFRARVPAHGAVLFHDSIRVRVSRIYGADAAYEHRVRDLMDELRQDANVQVLDLPYGDGLTLVRNVGRPEVLQP